MTVLQAIVLGIVQGVTEFLPVSSSAHLIIVPWLLGWPSPSLSFDAALHLGTLAAVLVYFWRDLLAMLLALPRALSRPGQVLTSNNPDDVSPRLALLIAIGTIPGLIVGYLGQGWIEEAYHADTGVSDRIIVAIAMALAGLALFLLVAERVARHERGMASLRLPDALMIGLAQAAALIPGVSRSGATITAGLFRGLKREDAARFSFLLGAPIIAAAGAKGLVDVLGSGLDTSQLIVFLIGLATSAISGFAAITVLLRYLQRSSTMVFIVYRILLAVGLVVLTAVR